MVRFGPHLVNEVAIRAVVLLPATACDPERYAVHIAESPVPLSVEAGMPSFEDVRDYVMSFPRQVEGAPRWPDTAEIEAR